MTGVLVEVTPGLFSLTLWRALAHFLAGRCERCGQERLLSVFDTYSTSRLIHCEGCLLSSRALAPLIRLLFLSLGVEDYAVMRATPGEKVKALEALYNRFHKSVTSGFWIGCYARGMTYYSRLGYERSGGRVFTVSEALSGYERMFREKFGLSVTKIVRKLAVGFGGCSVGLTYAGLRLPEIFFPVFPHR
jgi:hypothetical protein